MERLTAWSDYGAYFPKCYENPCGGNGPENDCDDCGFMEDVCQKLAQYEDIGTLEEVREAVEKQKAKKAEKISKGDKLRFGTCPCCERRISTVEGGNYCQNCGQRLDWSEEDEQ